MKICLVNLCDYEPLGLASVATYVEQHLANVQTKILDVAIHDLEEEIGASRPDIVGISAFTIQYRAAIQLAQAVKRTLDCPVILGGYHVSATPDTMHETFDVGVIGEGEETCCELLESFQKNGRFSKEELLRIDGLAFHDGSSVTRTKPRRLIEPLDLIPIIDRRHIHKRYHSDSYKIADIVPRAVNIQTSRGCPYDCVFCSPKAMWKKVRYFSIGRVAQEVGDLFLNQKLDSHIIVDDVFPTSKERIRSLISELRARRILGDVRFVCFGRADVLDDELCRLLKELNVVAMNFGFESGSEKTLRFLKGDSVSVADNLRAVRLCNEHGFYVIGTLILASPGETIADMRETESFVDFMIDGGTRGEMNVLILTPFPGTHIWRMAETENKVSASINWDHLSWMWETASKNGLERPLFLDAGISLEEFTETHHAIKRKANQISF